MNSSGPPIATPALFTRPTRPCSPTVSVTSSTAAAIAAGSVTSSSSQRNRSGNSAASRAPSSGRRTPAKTLQPSAISRATQACPIPVEVPVTRTALEEDAAADSGNTARNVSAVARFGLAEHAGCAGDRTNAVAELQLDVLRAAPDPRHTTAGEREDLAAGCIAHQHDGKARGIPAQLDLVRIDPRHGRRWIRRLDRPADC